MDGNWYFKVAMTGFFGLLAGAYLVWTVGGWSTDSELQAFEDRSGLLEAVLAVADGEAAIAQAQATLDDHLAKSPPALDGSGGGSHPDAHKRAPGWASLFPEKKLNLGLDLQGGIDLELQVEIRKALETAADRAAVDLCNIAEGADIPCRSERIEGSADFRVFISDDREAEARSLIHEKTGIYVYGGKEPVDGEMALLYGFEDLHVASLKETALKQAVETIRNRVDKFGVTEPVILTKGEDRITVQLPGLDDPQRAIDLVGRTAQLEFRMLYKEDEWSDQRVLEIVRKGIASAYLGDHYTDEQLAIALKDTIPGDAEILHSKKFDTKTMRQVRLEGNGISGWDGPWLVHKRIDMTGDRIEYAEVSRDQFGSPYVRMEMDEEGARIFSELSGNNVGKRMAIVLDNNVNSAPVFREKIPNGIASITMGDGNGPEGMIQSQDLVVVLRAGALPAPIEILHNRTVGKTLGDDSIASGRMAAGIAGIVVLLFMLLYYRGAGVIANIAVLLNMLFLLALLAAFGATITLPGIAGIILTIGMAVDANVIIYERIREEVRAGKSVRGAVAAGYEKATWTILAANSTTFITGAVLYSYGSGPIKGFAVTLMVGIFTSVFTALVVTRLIFDYLTHRRGIKNLSIGI
jgi:preprotein translocase subunit SecD